MSAISEKKNTATQIVSEDNFIRTFALQKSHFRFLPSNIFSDDIVENGFEE